MTDPIDRAPFYHDGMRDLQDRFDGRRVADGLEKHRLHFEFWEQDRKLIEEARFFFIATSYRDNVDCSMRSGDPVRITRPERAPPPYRWSSALPASSKSNSKLIAPDLERLALTPCPNASLASSGTSFFSSPLAPSCSTWACRVLR
jgi:hypothetical protein